MTYCTLNDFPHFIMPVLHIEIPCFNFHSLLVWTPPVKFDVGKFIVWMENCKRVC